MILPKVYEFSAEKNWKVWLIFWAIHGNEPCGTQVLEKLIQDIKSWKIKIESGKLIIIPICNPEAYKQNIRFVEENLNRVFNNFDDSSYERKLAKFLKGYIEKCDYLLDLHSFHTEWDHYLFQDFEDDKTNEFIKALWVKNIVTGWPELYGSWDEQDTVWYAYSQWKTAALIECWSHNDPKCFDIANSAVYNFLIYLGIINWELWKVHQNITKITAMVRKEQEWKLVQNFIEMQELKQGELIAEYNDGTQFFAEKDGNILLANSNAKIWHEWYYLAYKK